MMADAFVIAKSWEQAAFIRDRERVDREQQGTRLAASVPCPTPECAWRLSDTDTFVCRVHGGVHRCGATCDYLVPTREGATCSLTAAITDLNYENMYSRRFSSCCDRYSSKRDQRISETAVRFNAIRRVIEDTIRTIYFTAYRYYASLVREVWPRDHGPPPLHPTPRRKARVDVFFCVCV